MGKQCNDDVVKPGVGRGQGEPEQSEPPVDLTQLPRQCVQVGFQCLSRTMLMVMIIITHSYHHHDHYDNDDQDDHDDQDDQDDHDDHDAHDAHDDKDGRYDHDDQNNYDDQDDDRPALSKLPPQVLLGISLHRQTLGFVCKHKTTS